MSSEPPDGRGQRGQRVVSVLLAALSGLSWACDPSLFGPSAGTDAGGASPKASIAPRPLSTATAAPRSDGGAGRRRKGGGGGQAFDATPPPPRPYEPSESLTADLAPPREVGAVVLQGGWLPRVAPELPAAPQANRTNIEALRRLTAGRWRVELLPSGRMRTTFLSRAMPLPQRAALLGRVERYGNLVLWPNGTRFRLLAPGALRSVLGERRADVGPLSAGRITRGPEGSLLGMPTRMLRVESPYGRVELQLASMPEAGHAAPLLCRMLVEVAGLHPASPACREPEVVLAAEFRWATGGDAGGARFVVDRISRQAEAAVRAAVPPVGARQVRSGLPHAPHSTFFDDAELQALRSDAPAEPTTADPQAPESGLRARNQSDLLLHLLVDGVTVAAVAPWAEVTIAALRPGRYAVQWRSFLGEVVGNVEQISLPASVVYGAAEPAEQPDAG